MGASRNREYRNGIRLARLRRGGTGRQADQIASLCDQAAAGLRLLDGGAQALQVFLCLFLDLLAAGNQLFHQFLDFFPLRLFLGASGFRVFRSPPRRAAGGGVEGDPAHSVQGYFRPLVGLVGVHGLSLGSGRNGPAGHHPGRNAYGPRQLHKGAAEIAAGPLPALEQEPLYGVAARRWALGCRVGQTVGIVGLEVLLDGPGPGVVRAMPFDYFHRQVRRPSLYLAGDVDVEVFVVDGAVC